MCFAFIKHVCFHTRAFIRVKRSHKHALPSFVTQAPGFGERRKALLQDIAIVTGAEFIARDLGMKVRALSRALLRGSAFVCVCIQH